MNKKNEIISDLDKSFSKELLDLSTLKECKTQNLPFGKIVKSHGALVQDNKGNSLFDLRLQSDKPFFGHNHPLIIKNKFKEIFFTENIDSIKKNSFYELTHLNMDKKIEPGKVIIQRNLIFSKNDTFNFYPIEHDYYVELFPKFFINLNQNNHSPLITELLNYIEVTLINGQRVKKIHSELSTKLPSTVRVKGLLLIINADCEDLISIAETYGLLLNQNNLENSKIYLSIPTSFTKLQLNDLLVRITRFIGDI